MVQTTFVESHGHPPALAVAAVEARKGHAKMERELFIYPKTRQQAEKHNDHGATNDGKLRN